jgi:hypothetical protein
MMANLSSFSPQRPSRKGNAPPHYAVSVPPPPLPVTLQTMRAVE